MDTKNGCLYKHWRMRQSGISKGSYVSFFMQPSVVSFRRTFRRSYGILRKLHTATTDERAAVECKISCLPPELLAQIFILAQAESNQHPFFDGIRFEVLLSHVSRHWRAVSLTTRSLWNHIDIYTPYSLHRASCYLQRSGSQSLLAIYINLSNWERDHAAKNLSKSCPPFIRSIASHIIPHLHQIRSLSFTCFSESTCLEILPILRNASAPNLRQLEVKFDHFTFPFRIHPNGLKILEHGSSPLAFLKIDLVGCMPPVASLRGLTSFHLRKLHTDVGLTYPKLVEVLTAPDCLLYLSIDGTIDLRTWPFHRDAPDFQLHHLKALQIYDRGVMPAMLLLSISAPNLESLWLDCDFNNFSSFSMAPQLSFGGSKFPQLQYLTIPGMNLPFSAPLSSIFPSVTYLHLPHMDVHPFMHLETALSGQWSLHTLVFTVFRREADWKEIGDLIASCLRRRLSQGRPINDLLVDCDILRIMERKVRAGLPVETKVQLVSGENYAEPWWNQEDRLNALG
jgi:hypothetical protein